MHRHTHMHAWMDGCAFTRSALTQILNMVLQTFSQHRLRYRHLDSDKHQRKCFQNDSGAAFVFSTSRVPEPISAPFFFVWEAADGLKSMDVWLEISLQGIMRQRCCHDYSAMLPLQGTCCNDGGAEGRRVRSFSARCNQSHASSWCKKKQLDFQSVRRDVCAGVMCVCETRWWGQWFLSVCSLCSSSLWPCFVRFIVTYDNLSILHEVI